MNVHKNARLTPLVESGLYGRSRAGRRRRPSPKWVDRYGCEGSAGLQDRSSRPHRLRRPTPQAVVDQIEKLRRQRWIGKQIAAETGVSPATVSRVLRRLGLNKLSALEPAEPIRRSSRRTVFIITDNGVSGVGGGVSSAPACTATGAKLCRQPPSTILSIGTNARLRCARWPRWPQR
jgi:hypothetical protein